MLWLQGCSRFFRSISAQTSDQSVIVASLKDTVYINATVYAVNEKGIVFLLATETPATNTRMGRKPLNMKPTQVRLSPEALARIDELVGTYGRASFIREAIEAELKRREK